MENIAQLSAFHEISLLLMIAVVGGCLGLILRLPLVVSFIIVGIVTGPSVSGLAHSTAQLDLLANLGISLLLFVVGLKLDLHLIRTTGTVAAMTGLGQVTFTSIIGLIVCRTMGYSSIESAYISLALTFSSTIIIVKMLSDKGEADSLHGRVALGLLIVQDIVAVLLMIGLSAFGKTQMQGELWVSMVAMLIKGGLLLGSLALFMRYGVRTLLDRLAASSELMMLFAISFAVALSSFCDWLGFGKELGAFLAGISLASTPYREVIGSQLRGLRDFMLLFFFIGLGAHIDISILKTQLAPAFVLSLFVLIGNPLIMMMIMLKMGYRMRTSFLAGVTIAQISEFSLILLALAVQMGQISQEIVGLVTLVGLITIAVSSYMILYANDLYEWLAPWLVRFEGAYPDDEPGSNPESKAKGEFDVILFGLGRYGSNIARGLRQNNVSVLGVDFDPNLVRQWQRSGHTACYGDANDTHFPENLPLESAKWVISALPPPNNTLVEGNLQETLMQSLREHHFRGKIAVTAHTPAAVSALKRAGADLVLLPFHDAAASAVNALICGFERKDIRQGELL